MQQLVLYVMHSFRTSCPNMPSMIAPRVSDFILGVSATLTALSQLLFDLLCTVIATRKDCHGMHLASAVAPCDFFVCT